MRVVAGVEHHGRRTADDLEPGRRRHLGQSFDDDLGGQRLAAQERLDGGDRQRRVARHVRAEQRQHHIGHRATRGVEPQHLAAHARGAIEQGELDALAVHLCADLGAAFDEHRGSLGLLRRQHHLRTGLDDARLFAGDLGECVAQQVGVVVVDRTDHGDRGVHHVGGVGDAAQAHLDDRHVHRRLGEGLVGQRGHHLEERHRDAVDGPLVDQVDQPLGVCDQGVELVVADPFAVDADALGEVDQMRAGVATGAQAKRPQQRVDHDGGAALAVGAGDLDHGVGALW